MILVTERNNIDNLGRGNVNHCISVVFLKGNEGQRVVRFDRNIFGFQVLGNRGVPIFPKDSDPLCLQLFFAGIEGRERQVDRTCMH